MASKPGEPKSMKLKLLVDNRTNKVLFAEAGKDFVDFVFGLQQIPLGCIIALLKGNGVASSGSFGRVYQSIVDLDPTCLQPDTDKDDLLRPKVCSSPNIHTPLANYFVIEGSQSCSFGLPTQSHSKNAPFGSSGLVFPSTSQQIGWVKDGERFMVKDDLEIQTLSPISCIALINICGIKDLSSLEEKTVNIGRQEGLKILKALLESNTVLTDVFIQKTQPDFADDYEIGLPPGAV